MFAAVTRRSVAGMSMNSSTQRVLVTFAGPPPPAERVKRASGVSDVHVVGQELRCLVQGSFQPFLDALLGHEVVDLAVQTND